MCSISNIFRAGAVYSAALGVLVELLFKVLIYLNVRLAHKIKHLVACVFGGNLKLSADVMLYKLLEKLIVLILHHIVVSYTRTDKYTLDIFYGTYLSEHLKILAVVYLQCRARLGSKALFTLAKSRLFLLVGKRITLATKKAAEFRE